MKKINIGIICGGKSGEHEISLISARSIYDALDKKRYNVKIIGIDKQGNWHLGNPKNFWINPDNPKKVRFDLRSPKVTAVNKNGEVYLIDLRNGKNLARIDVFFPITHGTFGEDGCLQGFLELLNVSYVGPGVLGSAVCMDKDVMKRLFQQTGINTAKFIILSRGERKNLDKIIRKLKLPIFVKPANLGSSVGISKAENKKELGRAIREAFKYDNKIVLEETIVGREIEVSVMGNEKLIASCPGEIVLKPGFYYSYSVKYVDEGTAVPTPKAELSKKEVENIKKQAKNIFKALCCEGMARIDFFLKKNGKLYANELNTLPGFTKISMYPKMFEESGIPYSKLLDKLIKLGIERKKRNDKLKRTY